MRDRAQAAVLFAMVMASFAAIAVTGSFVLVSPAEYGRDQTARAVPTADGRTAGEVFDQQIWTRALDAPAIEVIVPPAGAVIHPPINIEVRFTPAPGASIDLSTLRIRYGVIGLDVTDRIRKAAKVTPDGIHAEGAKLPAGNHALSIEIGDNQGRKNKQTFKFRVEG